MRSFSAALAWLVISAAAANAGESASAPAPIRTAVREGTDGVPVRAVHGLHLVKMGWVYNCMDCHRILEARWRPEQPMAEHERITLRHGENRFCLNCHHATNRNVFSDYDGSEIAESDVVRLCAKCHGTIHRDWRAGIHGRRNGYWKAAAGARSQLSCIQCHDPHEPKFPSLMPLAAPTYPARAAHPPETARAETPKSH